MDLGTWGEAANDTDYKPSRHRTLPILASITPIANYPTKLRIFKTMASRYWQVRCFLKGRTYTQCAASGPSGDQMTSWDFMTP